MPFETLFGIRKTDVKRTCVLLPLLSKKIVQQLGVRHLSRGRIYSAGNSAHFTLIRTGVGPTLAGDAVLYLADTSCRDIILFGSCGLVAGAEDIRRGSLLSPSICYAADSFTMLLQGDSRPWDPYRADDNLHGQFLKFCGAEIVNNAVCLSIGSLNMEDELLPLFESKEIQALDMECASVFAAAAHTRRRAVALLCVTDIVGEKAFHAELSREDAAILGSSVTKAVRILCEFTEMKSADPKDPTRS